MVSDMRTIDAEPLEAQCKACINNKWNHLTAPLSWALAEESFLERLEEAPTIDAVPVVRCKDCKHYAKSMTRCAHEEGLACPDKMDFCSYGERKDIK